MRDLRADFWLAHPFVRASCTASAGAMMEWIGGCAQGQMSQGWAVENFGGYVWDLGLCIRRKARLSLIDCSPAGEVRVAQLSKTAKAGAASFVVSHAELRLGQPPVCTVRQQSNSLLREAQGRLCLCKNRRDKGRGSARVFFFAKGRASSPPAKGWARPVV
jgi:hypothetical protein